MHTSYRHVESSVQDAFQARALSKGIVISKIGHGYSATLKRALKTSAMCGGGQQRDFDEAESEAS
jgi:hypothetical protein